MSVNALRQIEQKAAALAHLLICQVQGIAGSYNSRGTGEIPVYMAPSSSTAEVRQTLGARVREITRSFEISSANTNFPPAAGIMEDDTITDENGLVYAIRQDDDGGLGAVLRFTGVCSQPKQSGQVGQ